MLPPEQTQPGDQIFHLFCHMAGCKLIWEFCFQSIIPQDAESFFCEAFIDCIVQIQLCGVFRPAIQTMHAFNVLQTSHWNDDVWIIDQLFSCTQGFFCGVSVRHVGFDVFVVKEVIALQVLKL